jgi:trehalose/maltose hydrolase-like predicted phosphorylase
VDDNAYTNVMARWNLRLAADLVSGHPAEVAPAEALEWREVADALVDGYDPDTRRYEQFAGYHRLEALLPSSLGHPPLAADLLLGADRIAVTQIIKQADVLMLHHLVRAEVAPGSLAANLDYYGPRTAHGSSLSPAIHALLLARAGAPDEALGWLRLAGRLDLAGLTQDTATGLHLATMGGLWQAIAFGFAGLQVDRGVLRVNPHLPLAWSALSLRLLFRGRRVIVSLRHDEVRIDSDGPVSVAFADGAPRTTNQAIWPLGRGPSTLPPAPSEGLTLQQGGLHVEGSPR